MHGTIPAEEQGAIFPGPESGIDSVPQAGANPGCGIDDDEWFYAAAVAVFGAKETGWHLHNVTGWPRTSCYAFVARDPEQRRKPPVEFLRLLFRTPQGAPFHKAFMYGCTAPWWRDHEHARTIGERVLEIVKCD